MKTNNKRKKVNPIKFAEKIRREEELSRYGKLVSLRPSKVMESKKTYKRKKYKYKEYEN